MQILCRRSSVALSVTLAGFTAGSVATFAQMLLWWLDGTPVFETLVRDARLTAALILGPDLLRDGAQWRWDVMIWATLIHFALSVTYAVVAWPFARRLRFAAAVAIGCFFGAAIYALNLHAFTRIFPWFEITRGGVTIAAHLVFGTTLFACCATFGARGADRASECN